jgi:hypothetical protein
VKTRKITIKRGETEIVVTTEDIYAWFIGLVMLVLAGTIAVLFLLGRTQEAMMALTFFSGMGATEGARRLLHPSQSPRKIKSAKIRNYSRVPLLFSFANTKYA